MFDRFQSEPYAMRRKPDFETETHCEKCHQSAEELRRVIELDLWVCAECSSEAMALVDAEGEVERKPVAAASAEARKALNGVMSLFCLLCFPNPRKHHSRLPGRLRFSLRPVIHLTCTLGPYTALLPNSFSYLPASTLFRWLSRLPGSR